jgi:negative regulator of sigma E activity
MKTMSCQRARRRLSASHDGELPTDELVAVAAHVRECARCTKDAWALAELGNALRERAAHLAAASESGMDALRSEIVNRIRVEQQESVGAQVGRMFEDMRLGFAALGSMAASVVSMLLVVGIFHFGPQSERPDSLSAMLQTLSPPVTGVDVRDLVGRQIVGVSPGDRDQMSAGTIAERVSDDNTETQWNEEDAVFALAAVVTRQGRIASLEVVDSSSQGGADREQVLRLLDQVSRARLEPARVGGAPVASRTFWVQAQTTVRAKMPAQPKQSFRPVVVTQILG